MRIQLQLLALGLFLLGGGCTPTACNEEESVVSREVEVLIGEPGPGVKEAKRRLVARGRSAIAILETGLYQADPLGRIRIVDVLASLNEPDALHVLRHIAKRDEEALVRERAQEALSRVHIESESASGETAK